MRRIKWGCTESDNTSIAAILPAQGPWPCNCFPMTSILNIQRIKKKKNTYKTYKNRWLNGPLEGHSLWYRNLKTQCKEVYFICTHKWLKRKVYCPSPNGSSHNFTSLFSIERKVAFWSWNSKWETNMDPELRVWFGNEQVYLEKSSLSPRSISKVTIQSNLTSLYNF